MKKFKKIIFLACFVMLIAVMAIAVSAYDTSTDRKVEVTLPSGVTAVNNEPVSGTTASLPLYDASGNALTWYVNGTDLTSVNTKEKMYVDKDGYLKFQNITKANIVVLNVQDDTIDALNNGENKWSSTAKIQGGTSLQYIYFADSTKGFDNQTFKGCTTLKGAYFGENSKVTELPLSTFNGCTGLEKVELPTNLITVGNYAFYKCTALTSINIPANVTTIGDFAFEECSKLTSINITDSKIEKIGIRAFRNCTSLGNVTLPNSVEEIGSRAFSGCNFTEINLGASLQNFGLTNSTSDSENGLSIFYHCYNLQKIVIPASLTISDNVTKAFNEFRTNGNTKPVKIFFTGNEKQANELLTKLQSAEKMPTSLKNAITIVDYNSDAYKNITETGSYIIYNYNHCTAFYGGKHTFSENPVLAYSKGFDQAGTSTCTCTRDNKCGYSKTTIIDPIFVALGYSTNNDGTAIYGGFTVDTTALANYNAYVGAGNELKYGIVVVNVGSDTNLDFGANGIVNSDKAIQVEINDTSFSRFGFTLTGFNDENGSKALNLVISAYVIDENGEMSFVQKTEDYSKTVTVNSVEASTLGAVKFTDVEAWKKASSVA